MAERAPLLEPNPNSTAMLTSSKSIELPVVEIHNDDIHDDGCANYNDEMRYDMNTTSRGYCLIINMREKRSQGNHKDVHRLHRLFTALQFAVEVYDDLTEAEIERLMEMVQKADHGYSCCFVMFILAHGGADEHGSAYFIPSYEPETRVQVSTIKEQVQSIPGLNDKPKLLFLSFQAGSIDTGAKSYSINGSDFLISFATNGYAFRDHDGTSFIQSLCDVFTDYHTKYDVATMMTIVTKKVADMSLTVSYPKKTVKQLPQYISTLRKLLYFEKPSHYTNIPESDYVFEKIINDNVNIHFEVSDDANLTPAPTIPDDGATSPAGAKEVLKIPILLKDVEVHFEDFSEHLAEGKDVLLMAATEIELRAVLGYLKPLDDKKKIIEIMTPDYAGNEKVYIGKYGQYPVVVGMSAQSQDRQGLIPATLATGNIMRAFKPRFIIGIGICYSVDIEKYSYCDIAVASMVCDFNSISVGEYMSEQERDSYKVYAGFSTGKRLINAFSSPAGFNLSRPDGHNLKVHCGKFISRSELINNLDRKEALIKLAGRGAIAGEMEAAGIMAAIENVPYDKNVQAIIIKAISDNADGNKDQDRHWKDYAADAVARYVHHQMDKNNGALR